MTWHLLNEFEQITVWCDDYKMTLLCLMGWVQNIFFEVCDKEQMKSLHSHEALYLLKYAARHTIYVLLLINTFISCENKVSCGMQAGSAVQW